MMFRRLFAEHVIKGRPVKRLLLCDPETHKKVSDSKGMEFYKKQIRIVFETGFINLRISKRLSPAMPMLPWVNS
jgi:hypothetical protein